jgi:YebC/PmpR family DNA-binding regulatory protein
MFDRIVHMSGHSHWSTIKRDKAANDAKRSQAFSKMSRAITVAAKQGGGDPDMNPSLRLAIEKAREVKMPKDNIERAVNKGLGISSTGQAFEEVNYEGYGPEGVAFLVQAITDNKNRTVSEIRNIFSRAGGSLGGAGSTSYIFSADPENPIFKVEITDAAVGKKLEDLFEELDDNDDVQAVYSNYVLPE